MQKNVLTEKIRTINIYFLLFVTFLVGYGRVFEADWGSMGKHPENFFPIPIILTIYLAFKEKGYRWPVTYREKIFLAYAVFISLIPLWAIYPDKNLDAIKEFWAAATYVALMMYNVRNKKEVKLLIITFLSGVIIRGCYSLYEVWDGYGALTKDRWVVSRYSKTLAPRASFRHYNVYGNFLLLPLSLLFSFFLYHSKGYRKKSLIFILFILLGLTLLATTSRAPLVAIMISILLFSLLLGRKAMIVITLICIILGSFIYMKPDSVISKRVESVKWEDHSLQSRVKFIWPAAIEIYKDHNILWGIGSGLYKKVITEESEYKAIVKKRIFAHAHSDFLQALVSQGLIGASIYIFFVFQVFYISWKVFRREISPFYKSIGAAGFIWIVAHVLAGIVHHEYTSSRYNMSVAFIVTIVLIAYYISCIPSKKRQDTLEASSSVLCEI